MHCGLACPMMAKMLHSADVDFARTTINIGLPACCKVSSPTPLSTLTTPEQRRDLTVELDRNNSSVALAVQRPIKYVLPERPPLISGSRATLCSFQI
jgi:hypothetical protein